MVGVSRSCSEFHFRWRRKAHSETRIWLPLPGTRHERFAVHNVPSEVTPILLGLDMLREFGLVINTDSAHCYSTKLRCRIPLIVLCSHRECYRAYLDEEMGIQQKRRVMHKSRPFRVWSSGE